MSKPRQLTVYPPAHHRGMIERLYRNIGGSPAFAEPPARGRQLPPGESILDTAVSAAEECAEVGVVRAGAQVGREVRKLVRQLCLQRVAAINLFLGLEDPACSAVVPELEKLGFFFAGILPCSRLGDALILQYLNNVDLDYTKIVAYSEAAKELLAYVRDHDPNASL